MAGIDQGRRAVAKRLVDHVMTEIARQIDVRIQCRGGADHRISCATAHRHDLDDRVWIAGPADRPRRPRQHPTRVVDELGEAHRLRQSAHPAQSDVTVHRRLLEDVERRLLVRVRGAQGGQDRLPEATGRDGLHPLLIDASQGADRADRRHCTVDRKELAGADHAH